MPGLLGTVRHAVLTSLLALGSLCCGDRAFAEDSLLLALTWEPGFCSGRAAAAECRVASREPRLVLHGLWPQWDMNGDGRRDDGDEFCVSGAFNRKTIIGLDRGDWRTLPPVGLSATDSQMLADAMPGTVVGLERHEWWKHGSCSGLRPDDYFAMAVARMREVQQGLLARLLVLKAGATVDRQRLLDAFEADFGRGSARALVLDCSREAGATALLEIRIRLKLSGIAQPLASASLAIPARAGRGDCGTKIFVPG